MLTTQSSDRRVLSTFDQCHLSQVDKWSRRRPVWGQLTVNAQSRTLWGFYTHFCLHISIEVWQWHSTGINKKNVDINAIITPLHTRRKFDNQGPLSRLTLLTSSSPSFCSVTFIGYTLYTNNKADLRPSSRDKSVCPSVFCVGDVDVQWSDRAVLLK